MPRSPGGGAPGAAAAGAAEAAVGLERRPEGSQDMGPSLSRQLQPLAPDLGGALEKGQRERERESRRGVRQRVMRVETAHCGGEGDKDGPFKGAKRAFVRSMLAEKNWDEVEWPAAGEMISRAISHAEGLVRSRRAEKRGGGGGGKEEMRQSQECGAGYAQQSGQRDSSPRGQSGEPGVSLALLDGVAILRIKRIDGADRLCGEGQGRERMHHSFLRRPAVLGVGVFASTAFKSIKQLPEKENVSTCAAVGASIER